MAGFARARLGTSTEDEVHVHRELASFPLPEGALGQVLLCNNPVARSERPHIYSADTPFPTCKTAPENGNVPYGLDFDALFDDRQSFIVPKSPDDDSIDLLFDNSGLKLSNNAVYARVRKTKGVSFGVVRCPRQMNEYSSSAEIGFSWLNLDFLCIRTKNGMTVKIMPGPKRYHYEDDEKAIKLAYAVEN